MNFRDKFIAAKKCYFRSVCKKKADRQVFESLFEREWEVFVIKRDPATGALRGHTLCCDEAPVHPGFENIAATSCG